MLILHLIEFMRPVLIRAVFFIRCWIKALKAQEHVIVIIFELGSDNRVLKDSRVLSLDAEILRILYLSSIP